LFPVSKVFFFGNISSQERKIHYFHYFMY